jgi:hypothetical protein
MDGIILAANTEVLGVKRAVVSVFQPISTCMYWTGTQNCPPWRLAGGEQPGKRRGLGNKAAVIKHDVFGPITWHYTYLSRVKS